MKWELPLLTSAVLSWTSLATASALAQPPFVPAEPPPGTARTVFSSHQLARAFVQEGRTAPLDSLWPVASLHYDFDMRLTEAALSFHIVWRTVDGDRRPSWVVRERRRVDHRATTRYADSSTCPVIDSLLMLAEQMEPPVADLPYVPTGVETRQATNDYLHDATHTWTTDASFASSRTSARLSISGGSLTPVGALYRTMDAALAPCWRGTPPPLR